MFTIIQILQGREAAYSKTKPHFGKFSSVHYLLQTDNIFCFCLNDAVKPRNKHVHFVY